MSPGFRDRISQLCDEAEKIIGAKKEFPLPIKTPPSSDKQYYNSVQALLNQLNITYQTITNILTDYKSSHDSWMNLRMSMTETDRGHDSVIYESFLRETSYIEKMYELKRYRRILRNSRLILENNLPKIEPQIDHIYLLPELPQDCLPTLNPSQNSPFNENNQPSLKSHYYANSRDCSYRNRPSIQSNIILNPSDQGQISLSPVAQEEAPTLAYPTKPKPNIFYSPHTHTQPYIPPVSRDYPSIAEPQQPIFPVSHTNKTNCLNNKMNKFNPLAIPPGFSPLEEINVEENPNDLNNQMNEKIVLNKRLTREIINKRPISPPPGFTPIEKVCITKNICKESTPLQEIINEDNEAKAYNYSKEMPLVLTDNLIPDLSPEDPLISLGNLQQSTSSVTFNSSSGTTNINSSETDYILTSKEILVENKPLPHTLNYSETFCIEKRKESPIPRKRQRKKLPKQLNRKPTIINNSRSNVTARQIHPKRLKITPPNNRKYFIIPSNFNVPLNDFKQIHEENPCSPLPSPKMPRLKGNESRTPKTLFPTLDLFEIQCVHHSVINWKEILSKIKQHDTLM
uniref:Uncharacterized protein n=1 Tax=Meloidogyne floridensis TaxID=298350 RepID=A0A915NCQ0_9BILA